VAIIKGRTLDIIVIKIKEIRQGVDKMSTAFIRRLQLKQNYKDGDYEAIYSNELQFKDLFTAGA
jgi:hypothetical protein